MKRPRLPNEPRIIFSAISVGSLGVLALLLVVGVIAMVVRSQQGSIRPPDPRAIGSLASGNHQPNQGLGGVGNPFLSVTTLSAAESVTGSPIPRPNDTLASDDTITAVRMDAKNLQFVISYASGINEAVTITEMMDANQATQNDLSIVQTLQRSDVFVQTVDGVPALVVAGNFKGDCDTPPSSGWCAPPQSNPTDISFTISGGLPAPNGFAIELYAPGTFSTDTLIQVANTIS